MIAQMDRKGKVRFGGVFWDWLTPSPVVPTDAATRHCACSEALRERRDSRGDYIVSGDGVLLVLVGFGLLCFAYNRVLVVGGLRLPRFARNDGVEGVGFSRGWIGYFPTQK